MSPGIQIILVVVLANHRVLINICFISLHRIWYVGFHSKNAEQNQVVHGQQWCGVCSPRVRASLVNQCRTLSMAQWVGQGVLPGFQPWVSIPPGGGGASVSPCTAVFCTKHEICGLERGHRAFPPAPQAAESANQVSVSIRRPKLQPHHSVQKLPRLIQGFSYRRNTKRNAKAHFQVHVKHKTHVIHHWL